MDRSILEFIKSQRVCVFAIEMMDGSPHGATVHFAHAENPLIFVFETSRPYRKAEPLFARDVSRSSLVLGFEEGANTKTFQADGEARLLRDDEEHLKKLYLNKFPEKQEKLAYRDDIFFVFIPTWWRFTDWSRPEGKTICTSDGQVSIAGKIVNE